MAESPFSTQLKCLKVIGFHSGFDSKAKTALHVACSLLIVFAMMSELYAVMLNFNDVLTAAEAFGPFSAELICLSKFLSFYCFKRKFYSLIERVEALTGWSDDSNILTSLKSSLSKQRNRSRQSSFKSDGWASSWPWSTCFLEHSRLPFTFRSQWSKDRSTWYSSEQLSTLKCMTLKRTRLTCRLSLTTRQAGQHTWQLMRWWEPQLLSLSWLM